jgi:hypothetical protein
MRRNTGVANDVDRLSALLEIMTTRLLSCGHEHTEAEILSLAGTILAKRRRPGVGGRPPKPSHCLICLTKYTSTAAAKACCRGARRLANGNVPRETPIYAIREVVDIPTKRAWKLTRELQRPLARQFIVSSWCTDVRLSETCFSELAPAEAEFERRVRANR